MANLSKPLKKLDLLNKRYFGERLGEEDLSIQAKNLMDLITVLNENDNKSINVKRGIRSKCEQGWRPGVAPLGYMNRAFGGVKDIIPDPERAPIIAEMFRKSAHEGYSGRKLKAWLDEQGFTNRSGTQVSLSQVLVILSTPFYYGKFQYPEAPDAPWYQGAHKPLISKELYDQVQLSKGAYKGVWGSKTFAFRGLLKCGRC